MRQFLGAQDGYAALTMTLVVLFASLAIIGGLTFFSLQEVAVNRTYISSVASYYVSEGGIEDGVYRVLAGKQIGALETLGAPTGTTSISVSTDPDSSKVIRSAARVGTIQQNVETRLAVSTDRSSFVYGVQVGNGGISMMNSSQVQGSVFSNGSITGKNSPTITGDAFVAGMSEISGISSIGGNAAAHSISKSSVSGYASSTTLLDTVTVGKDAHASDIRSSTISGNAFYQTISGSTVGGTKFPATPPPADIAPVPMPIDEATLDGWENDAAAGGTISGPCPYRPADGAIIGPVKILCDLQIDGTKTITLGGAVWVAGNISVANSATLRLVASFSGQSGIIIADNPADRLNQGTVSVQNSSQIVGSGTPGSYVVVVSRNSSMEEGGDVEAMDVGNSSQGPIYYAPHGKISISNALKMREATAYGVEMKNSSTLIYEIGLKDVLFSTGPQGGYTIQYWKPVF
ncbi:MAG: hypothetical protein HY221_01425 [Candidatus Sungbacteria bacterium]|uniref:Type 4 fimbrial biogenesis protein PilX N-terminal domain-containing protein n=1 Tax=Candidatus Sungiibacteriota bacterium TaxID=2750080 RepID=A0A932QY75_9BACT|nr:hypothetical protein [Candidatus Sungbacteria bacterium]